MDIRIEQQERAWCGKHAFNNLLYFNRREDLLAVKNDFRWQCGGGTFASIASRRLESLGIKIPGDNETILASLSTGRASSSKVSEEQQIAVDVVRDLQATDDGWVDIEFLVLLALHKNLQPSCYDNGANSINIVEEAKRPGFLGAVCNVSAPRYPGCPRRHSCAIPDSHYVAVCYRESEFYLLESYHPRPMLLTHDTAVRLVKTSNACIIISQVVP